MNGQVPPAYFAANVKNPRGYTTKSLNFFKEFLVRKNMFIRYLYNTNNDKAYFYMLNVFYPGITWRLGGDRQA